MELGYIMQELWRLRAWVALGLVVATGAALASVYELPSLDKKSLELGAARTEVLVDAPRSPLGAVDAETDARIDTLVDRAGIYSQLIGSPPVKQRIARSLGVPVGLIQAQGEESGVETNNESSGERSNELLAEGLWYRVFASAGNANIGLTVPVLSISTEAPTAEAAIKLADASAAAVASYVLAIQERQEIPPSTRVQITQLGPATGGVVNEGVSKTIAALWFAGTLIGWCLLVLAAAHVRRSWRSASVAADGPVPGRPVATRPPSDSAASPPGRNGRAHQEVKAR